MRLEIGILLSEAEEFEVGEKSPYENKKGIAIILLVFV